ncbi:MAG: nickel-dependent hydrogenase large subunit [Magnetovibrionaceae bacterium]
MTRITIDPITRIEGHLRVDVEVEGGKVNNAWSSGQMWRGIELILEGRDPRDAWVFTQRFCGVCTTVHAITSVRAVENALDLEVPMNAQYIRNIIVAAHGMHDHIVHLYHLAALDWVDIVSALDADPAATAKLAASLSDYKGDNTAKFKEVQDKLKQFVGTGQLGVFASGYWGHPAMKLPPEVNLLAAAHYLEALDVQRVVNRIVSILGSKSPHIQNLAVGGVANPINPDSQQTLTIERLYAVKQAIDDLKDFVHNAMMTDTGAIGALYADWTGYGAGVMNYLSVPEMPLDTKGTKFALPGGYMEDGKMDTFTEIKDFHDEYFHKGVAEAVEHSWYDYDGDAKDLHPWDGQTKPNYTDFQDDGKYSWIKAPTFYGKRAQVGPLPNVFHGIAAGHESTIKHATKMLDVVKAVAKVDVGPEILHSTIGRIAARTIRTAVLLDEMENQWNLLMENIAGGDYETFNAPVFPKGEIRGVGMHEAPRGVLSHWCVIEDGKIKNYQAVVPSTWNAGPRDAQGQLGPYEASLMDNPVADPELPLEVLRTVHSFDPCIACAIHMVDTEDNPIVQVKAL